MVNAVTAGPTPRGLDELVRDAQLLGTADFSARYGDAFLVHAATDDEPSAAPEPAPAAAATPFDDVATTLNGVNDDDSAETGFLVLPVRRKETSHFEFVSVGRHGNNDVVIADGSVSKFHAIIKTDAGGNHWVFDGGSTNGTYVDGKAAPTTKDRARPLPLGPGSHVRFGYCEFTFMLARHFCESVSRRQ